MSAVRSVIARIGIHGPKEQPLIVLYFYRPGSRGAEEWRTCPGPNSYAAPIPRRSQSARIPTCHGAFMQPRRAPMLTLALMIGFAFVCLVVVYDRLTKRL